MTINQHDINRARVSWLAPRVRTAAGILIFVLLLGFTCMAQSSDESLGEVVRQKKPTRKAARVITNDEIPSVAVPTSEPAQPANTPESKDSGPKSTAAPDATKAGPKSSKSGITVPGVLTNGTLEQARSALETLQHDRQAFINNYDKIQRELAETDNDALRQSYTDILATREKTLARNAKQIADMEDAIHAAQNADAQGGMNETH